MLKKTLTIAVLVKRFTQTGGSEKYALEVARRLTARGHEVHLYSREAEAGATSGMTFFRVPVKLSFSSVLSLYSFAAETASLLQDKSYDIIHSHERGWMGQDVATLHSFSYRGSGYKQYPWWKKILQVYLSPRSWLHLRLESQQMDTPWLVAVSNAIAQDAVRYYGRSELLEVITPGVDTGWFQPDEVRRIRPAMRQEAGLAAEEMLVLFVGSEFRRKGLDLLVPALGPGMRLMVVGRGERLAHYQELVRSHGLSGRVSFIGLAQDVRKYYAMADLVVLPSRSEAFGMTILEAMACGLPVVTSANAGVAALIKPGVNGLVFRDPAELRGLLAKMQKDRAGRQAMGIAARKTAEEHGWDRTADKYEALFMRLAAAKYQGRL